MGFLDKLKRKPQLPTTVSPYAAAGVLLMIIAAKNPDENTAEFKRILEKLPKRSSDDGDEAQRLILEPHADRSSKIAICKNSLDMDQRLFVIANMIEIAMADGTIQNEEQEDFEYLVAALEVNSSAVEKIVEVMGIKNNFAAFA